MTELIVQGLTKHYGSAVALDRVDVRVEPGRRTVVVGPSGCGKSTLIRLIAGFERPQAGQIVMDGVSVADGPRIVPAHRRGIGVVSQDGALFPHLDVAANIAFGLPRGAADRTATVRRLMEMVELDPTMATRRPDQLSGGQQQRVALARALAPSPRLILLDEPFSSLDTGLRASTRRAVMALIDRAGVTTVLVTHDQEEALSFADHLVLLRGGRVEQAGAPGDVYRNPVNAFVARFFGEAVLVPARFAGGIAHCALGALALSDERSDGNGMIMVRAEQIGIRQASGDLPRARVEAVEFCGASVAVEIVFDGMDMVPRRLVVRTEQQPQIRPGEVSVEVRGPVVAVPA